jgi:hypothetical protein
MSLCDDGHYCTMDEFSAGTETCVPPAQRRLVNCAAGNACTQEVCDPTANSGTGACVTTA